MRVLIMTPYGLYRRWPSTPDTTKMVTNSAPVTMAQLAAMLPEHECRIFDGNVYTPPLERFVADLRWADVIAMNVMSTYSSLNSELNVRFMRKVVPGKPIVLGGHHATFYVDEWMERPVDAVVRREGELTFPDLIDAFENGRDLSEVAGISWKDESGRIHHNPDRPFIENLDSLPLPRWDLVDWSGYNLFLARRGKAACLETSRGCEHHCQFCQVGPMWRHTHRWKSPERVVEELRDLHARGVRQLFVVDDNYGDSNDVERQKAIYDAWRKSGLDFEWGTFMRADYIRDHPELIEMGAQIGLCYAFVGFETVSDSWLKAYGKGFRGNGSVLQEYQEAFRTMRKNDVLVNGFLVVGFPGQTVDDLKASLETFPSFCDYPVVTFYKPLKGTAGYRYCEKKGLLTKDSFYHDSQAVTVHGTEGLLPVYNRFFLRLLADPRNVVRAFASERKLERDMIRSIYTWFATGALNVNRDSFADWLTYKTRKESPQELIDRLTGKYLSDRYVNRIAKPFLQN